MSILALIGYIAGAIGFIATVAAAVVVSRSATTKTTIDSQKELIDTLIKSKEVQEDQIEDLRQKYVKSSNSIASLQAQVDILKNIPLKEISSDLKDISANQAEIVRLLKKNGHPAKPATSA